MLPWHSCQWVRECKHASVEADASVECRHANVEARQTLRHANVSFLLDCLSTVLGQYCFRLGTKPRARCRGPNGDGGGSSLQHASEQVRGDRESVLAAVARDGVALQHASAELRGDREVSWLRLEHPQR